MTPLPKYGLYAITDENLTPGHSVLEQVQQAIRGGAVIIQYRKKTGTLAEKIKQASAIQIACRHHNVPLIINDSVALAKEIGADGVHLGSDDESIATARHHLGDHAIIGASCYNDYQRAVEAKRQGASYIAFGRFFPSATKPDALQAEISLLEMAKQTLDMPLVAIGGITPENGPLLVEAGANFLAVVAGVFASDDPEHAARRYAQIYQKKLNI